MSRLHTLFAAVPVFAGGVLLGSAPSRADAGHHVGYWPSSDATIVAQVDPMPPRPPHAPMPPRPMHGPHSGSDISVTIHDGKVQIDGIKGMVDGRIAQALEAVRNMPDVPADVRARLVKRLERVQRSLDKRLSHLDVSDLDQLGDELGKMGDEIGREMDEFGKEMEKYGKDLGKNWGKSFGKKWGRSFAKGVTGSVDTDSDADSDSDTRRQ